MKYDVAIYVGTTLADKACPAELKFREVVEQRLPKGLEKCLRAYARQEKHGVGALARKEDIVAAAAWRNAAAEAEEAAKDLLEPNGKPVTIVVTPAK